VRPVVIGDSTTVTIQLAKPGQSLTVSIDSASGGQLAEGDTLVLAKCPRILPLAMLPERPFAGVLREKLKWAGSNV